VANGLLGALGFGPVVNARYFNEQDSRFGRDMNCIAKLGGDELACYVTNYGEPVERVPGPGDDPGAALEATITRDPKGLVATVAMEFRANSSTDQVTFYAFDGNGDRTTTVILDGEGGKGMPGVCLSCHGGHYDGTAHSVTGAHFLPFDVDNFEYSGVAGFRLADQ